MTIGPVGVPGPALQPLNVAAAGETLLDLTLAYLDSYDGWVRPSRIGMVPGGTTAFDDDQLTVNFTGFTPGMPGKVETQAQSPFQTLIYYGFTLTLIRATPVQTSFGRGSIPSPAALYASFVETAFDAQCLMQALLSVRGAGQLVPVSAAGPPFYIGPLDAVGPEGAVAGCRATVGFQAGVSTVVGAF